MPVEVWGAQIVIEIVLFVVIGLILFCGVFLREHFFWAHLVVIGFWAWDFVIVELIRKEEFLWLSLVSMAKFSNLSFGNVERGPSFTYLLIVYMLVIVLLLMIGYKQIKIYDFSKE